MAIAKKEFVSKWYTKRKPQSRNLWGFLYASVTVFRKYILTLTPMFLYHIGVFKKRGEIMDESKLTPEELEEMEKQFWEIVRKYRPEIFEENESDTE